MKSFVKILYVFGVVSILTGCLTPGGLVVPSITPEVRNAIAYCSSGIESETGVKIEAAVVENGGKIDATLGDKIGGVFAKRPGLTSADAISSQKLYMECLDKRSSKDKISSIDACQAKLACELDTMEGLGTCTKTVTDISTEKGYPDSFRDKMLEEKCYSGQHDLRKCWNGEDANIARSSCTVLLQNNGREVPNRKK